MRISFIFVITAAVLLGLSGCKKAEEAADKAADATKTAASQATDGAKKAADMAADGADKAADTVKEAVAGASKATYVKAAVAIGCLGKSEKDPAQLASKSMELQKKFGFDAKTWGEWATKMAQDADAAKEIAKGLGACK